MAGALGAVVNGVGVGLSHARDLGSRALPSIASWIRPSDGRLQLAQQRSPVGGDGTASGSEVVDGAAVRALAVGGGMELPGQGGKGFSCSSSSCCCCCSARRVVVVDNRRYWGGVWEGRSVRALAGSSGAELQLAQQRRLLGSDTSRAFGGRTPQRAPRGIMWAAWIGGMGWQDSCEACRSRAAVVLNCSWCAGGVSCGHGPPYGRVRHQGEVSGHGEGRTNDRKDRGSASVCGTHTHERGLHSHLSLPALTGSHAVLVAGAGRRCGRPLGAAAGAAAADGAAAAGAVPCGGGGPPRHARVHHRGAGGRPTQHASVSQDHFSSCRGTSYLQGLVGDEWLE